jgi:hypothetical protein
MNDLDSLPETLRERHFIFMENNDKCSIDPRDLVVFLEKPI